MIKIPLPLTVPVVQAFPLVGLYFVTRELAASAESAVLDAASLAMAVELARQAESAVLDAATAAIAVEDDTTAFSAVLLAITAAIAV